uniref:Uncharacterized protein n=1 Tax=Anguilla anguilla TaxID=7936 RepID=A0A0E9PVC1_ANGAN
MVTFCSIFKEKKKIYCTLQYLKALRSVIYSLTKQNGFHPISVI